MWGDPERAASLKSNDPLATILFQVSSPAHIPWADSRWQELLHGYDVWVHLEDTDETDSGVILKKACHRMEKHATVSSNLAALSLHVTRMLLDLVKDILQTTSQGSANAPTSDLSIRISRVGKARATAGALRLLRLLLHPMVKNRVASSDSRNITGPSPLEAALLYHTRGDLPCDQPTGRPLVHSILDLIVATGSEMCDALETPEIYDATVMGVQLLLVLCATQLYQPFQSSFQTDSEADYENYVLDEILRSDTSEQTVAAMNYRLFYSSSRSNTLSSSNRDMALQEGHKRHHVWTHSSILATCIHWQIQRPAAPEQSIAHYYYTMTQAAVSARGGLPLGRDGMYESYLVVHANAPTGAGSQISTAEISADNLVGGASHRRIRHQRQNQNSILDATKGAILLGSSIIMLPFRLMSLVFGVIRSTKKGWGSEDARLFTRRINSGKSRRTRDVLWLSDCILSDLMTSFVLLLVNNRRKSNPFRKQLVELTDDSWQSENDQLPGLPDLPTFPTTGDEDAGSISASDVHNGEDSLKDLTFVEGVNLRANFDALYDSFGRSLHTEVGVLMLYTLYQACPRIAETMVVRSELDRLVLPLLRTLYLSSNTQTYVAKDFIDAKTTDHPSTIKLDIRNFQFRSFSQLYVIVILLLLFSQDTIFGRDAFRRIRISHVPWYKERNLRHINLGSVVLLTLLRSLLFNLHRLQDAFLLSNCCAVLQNLSPSIVDLHDYTAMRLASVTVSVMKMHLKLSTSSSGQETTEQRGEIEDFLTTPVSMYDEVARTLLETIYKCLAPKTIERNLHLVYALVYHQADFVRVLSGKKLYATKLLERIQSVISEASTIIQGEGARTGSKALSVLEGRVEHLQKIAETTKRKKESEDIVFTYEEEVDPEIFFVPYVWETIVSVVTSGTIEWKKDDIHAFPLLDPADEESTWADESSNAPESTSGQFSEDVSEVV